MLKPAWSIAYVEQAVTIEGNGLEERFRSGLHVAVQNDFSLMAHDTDRHGTGVRVATAVMLSRTLIMRAKR